MTTIAYSVPKNVHVHLKIYNLLEQELATLVNEKIVAGEHRVRWNAQNMASGLYFYKITMGNCSISKRMILLR
jgi:hypothetical protein